MSEPIACRKCNSNEWKLLTTTIQTVDTQKGLWSNDAYRKTEYRCAVCNIKATVAQTSKLQAIESEEPKVS